MNNTQFKSQLCTTREQSQELLALGLRPHTADMVYHRVKSMMSEKKLFELQAHPPTLRGDHWTPERIALLANPYHRHPDGTLLTGEEVFDMCWADDIPSWSLSRLLEMLPQSISQFHRPDLSLRVSVVGGTYWHVHYEDFSGGNKISMEAESLFEAVYEMTRKAIGWGYYSNEFLNRP